MRGYISYLGLVTMTLTSMLGLGAHRLVNRVGDALVESSTTAYKFSFAALQQSEARLIPPRLNNCGYLLVTVRADGTLYLGSREAGSLTDPRSLRADLEQIFRGRTKYHQHREGIEATSEVPLEERIEKTVYLRAPRWLSYGEIGDLLRVMNDAGANPILLAPE